MNRRTTGTCGLAVFACGLCATATHGDLTFDQDITPDVIFGSGNANGAWTVDQANGVELGLRAKLRFDENNQPQNIFNSNGDGTYTFNPGAAPGGFGFDPNSPTTPVWNFEWSVNVDYENSGGSFLSDYTYEIGIDFDPGVGVTNFLVFDMITPAPPEVPFWDHAIGNNSTGNGGGTSAGDAGTYQTLIDNNNVAQNSWNYEFFNDAPFDSFDPNDLGEYTIYITAFDETRGVVAHTEINIIIPTPGALAMLGVAGLIGGRRRRRV